MQLSVTSWSFPACTLAEATAISKALGIGAIDLGYFYRPALDKAALLAQPEAMARKVLELGLPVPCFFHLFGATLAERNLADAASLDRNASDFRAVIRFCRAAHIPTIFVLPGVTNPGQGKREALANSARALSTLVQLAQAEGLTLTIEPHVHSYLDSPDLVLELLKEVPGLRLTLDYAHFVCMGYTQPQIDVLAPHAAHIHLRQAKPGCMQTKLDQGTLDFNAMLGLLRSLGYDRTLAIEFVHQAYMDTLHDDVLTETVAMRDLVRNWMA